MKRVILVLIVSFCVFINAQNDESKFGLGLGFGQMFGGIGAQLNYEVANNFDLFSGLGYNFNDLGFNAGVKYKLSEKRTKPFLTAMYGYNVVAIVENRTELNKTFYGLTVGGGFDTKSRKNDNYWTFAVLFPFVNDEFDDYQKANLLALARFPLTISVGYIFGL